MMTTDPGREVQLSAGGLIYTLYGGNRALRLIERETGKPLPTLLENLDGLGFMEITTVIWALLQRHHPDLTIDDTDDVIDAAGLETVSEAMGQALERAFPFAVAPDDAVAAGKAPAANGTGARSSPARSRRG